ncbi:MAG: UDP-N-acetylmuramate dehydrogenase [Alphaproteobacteria bacterium]|nr:UDP-N-acetylmuramate dehydrogenase [Alphaproteobacteria bacterium]
MPHTFDASFDDVLRADLPPVRGRYQLNIPLKKLTWFAVGGPAEILFKPKDLDDLIFFLKENALRSAHGKETLPIFTLGAGSNIIVRDNGIKGVTLRLTGDFSEIQIRDNIVEVGSGCLDRTLALTCQSHGLGGLEFFIGIPGTIGGALAMNAGAYGSETKDRLLWAEAIAPDGTLHRLSPDDMEFRYRHCSIPKDWIFVKAAFYTTPTPPEEIQRTLHTILERRQETQPVKGRTGGSTFKNPIPQAAWELIDQAGCRGMMVGDAMMSEKHCNFMLNLGNASAKNLEDLGEKVRHDVLKNTGIDLVWEILRVGEF